jgi:peptidoglycan/xylan/chitin deacetylase (PgdA/CDA1 family)
LNRSRWVSEWCEHHVDTMQANCRQQSAASQAFVCLMYHNVYPDGSLPKDVGPASTAYWVGRQSFDVQLRELQQQEACCWDLGSLNQFFAGAAATGAARKAVVVTFDDGWRGSVEQTAPALQKYRYRALLFVTSGLLGQPHFLERRDLWRLPTDLFTIGSHGATHRLLCTLPDSEIRDELERSKGVLEDATGRGIDSLSIPGGASDARVLRIAVEVGYRFVFTSRVQVNTRHHGPLAIGRVAIKHNTSPAEFRSYVHQRLGRARLHQALRLAPKQLLGLKRYHRVRHLLLGHARCTCAAGQA